MDNLSKSVGCGIALSNAVPTDNTISATAPGAVPVRLRNGTITVAELVNRYMSEYQGRDPSRGQRLRWWITQLGDVQIVDLSDDDDRVFHALEGLAAANGRYYCGADADNRPIYKSKRKALAPATVNRFSAALSAVFTWGERKRITPARWQSPFRRIQRRAENNEIVRHLSAKEREALLCEARHSAWPKMYLLILFALTTGARKGELLALRWSDLDLDIATASLARSKNGDRRVLPLTESLVAELRKHIGAPGALVFASRRRPDTHYNFHTSWCKALRDAHVRSFRFHDLRHTAASMLAMSGASLIEIADVLGHRNLSVTKRYSHLTTGHKANLIRKVLGGIK